jgi:DNA topoisomerase-1
MNHKLYLTDPGIFKKGNKYYFNKSQQEITNEKTINHLNSIRVPPAWNNVWYASDKKCHIQVHGIDNSGKKQYILSQEWVNNSKFEKFNRMKTFIKCLSAFKNNIKLNKTNVISKEIIIKLLFNLLIDIHIRVGNEKYAEKNKTYGLTTLRQKHLVLKDNKYYLSFLGKSKIKHLIEIPEIYNQIMKKLSLNTTNSPLFYWYENKTTIKTISSEELNNYLKDNMGSSYTCKDFRTYSANMLFIKAFLKNSKKNNSVKKVIIKSIDDSAVLLGHTRNICKKSYISENLINYCTDSFSDASRSCPSELLCKVWDSGS